MDIVSNFNMSANKFLDSRKSWASLADLKANKDILMPNGFLVYCRAENEWYQLNCTDDKDTTTYTWDKFKTEGTTLTEEQVNDINDIPNINEKIKNNYLLYDTFPSSEEINKLDNDTIFETKGYYTKGDGYNCKYKIVSSQYGNNSFKPIGSNKYIMPLNQQVGEIYLPYYGIRTGATNAENNTNIFKTIEIIFGSLIKFSSGHFYFNEGLDMGGKQLKLIGATPVGFAKDSNTIGLTWLHFNNLNTDNDVCISATRISISNVVICGNPDVYSCKLDRTKTYTDSNSIVSETNKAIVYGIKATSSSVIDNVGFVNLYYGLYCDTANTIISNITTRECHIGVSIGNDTKLKGLYSWDTMIALEMRGSISSAIQVRGDSIGKHLVNILEGNSQYLSDLDADYCFGSILHLGNSNEDKWTSVGGLIIDGIHGRANVSKVYDSSTDAIPTGDNIATNEDIELYPLISVANKTNINGALITMNCLGNVNPLDDVTSTYKTPSILLGGSSETAIKSFKISTPASIEITNEWIDNRIKSLSDFADNMYCTVSSSNGEITYIRNGSKISHSKTVISTATDEEIATHIASLYE